MKYYFVVLLALAILPLVSAYRQQNITFYSPGSSGNLWLNGTIVYPDADPPAGGYPGAVLIHGSGPSNRWEYAKIGYFSAQLYPVAPYNGDYCYYRSNAVHPFQDISRYLADHAGMAVLVWDKRSCLAANMDGCELHACFLPNQQNCLNTSAIMFSDFVDDAVNAVDFLLNNFVVQPQAYLVGHSEGCIIAPMVANQLPGKIAKIALLAGIGTPLATTTQRQFEYNIQLTSSIINGSLCDPSISYEKQILDNAEASLPIQIQTNQEFQQTIADIKAGKYGENPYTPVLVPGVAKAPLGFWYQIYNATEYSSFQYYLGDFLKTSTNLLMAVNSPTDLQVAPLDYLPLHTILAKYSNAQINLIDGITHLLCETSFINPRVTQAVQTALVQFLTNGAK